MKTAAPFALVALILLAWASALPPYKDPHAVMDAKSAKSIIPVDSTGSSEATGKYRAVRESQLTWKFRLQDYGATAISIAATLGFLSGLSRIQGARSIFAIKAPAKSRYVLAVAIAAIATTTIAFVASIFLGVARDEYPPWADSIGIPLLGTPVVAVGLTVAAALFYWAGSLRYSGGTVVLRAFMPLSCPRTVLETVFDILLIVAVVALVFSAISGDFLSVIPGALWAMFFGALRAGQRSPSRDGSRPTARNGG